MQAQSVSENRGHQHRKIALEQCHKHGGCAIYVPQHWQLLPDGSLRILRVHENFTRVIPGMDNQTVDLKSTCTQQVCPLGDEMGSMGPSTSRDTSQQKITTQIGTAWVSLMRQHTGTLVPRIKANIFHTRW